MPKWVYIVSLIVLWAGVSLSGAQEINEPPAEPVRDVHFRSTVGTDVGYVIRSFLQSSGAMAWSQDGRLFVVDAVGGHIVIYSGADELENLGLWQLPELNLRDVRGVDVYEEWLWFNTSTHVYGYNFVNTTLEYAIRLDDAGYIGDVVVDDDGVVHFTTRDRNGAVWRLDVERGTRTRLVEGIPFAEYMALADDGTLYVSQKDYDTITAVNLRFSRADTFFTGNFGGGSIHLALAPDGALWARSDGTLYQINTEGESIPYETALGIYDGAWHELGTNAGLAFDGDGFLWLANHDGGLWQVGLAGDGQAIYSVEATRDNVNVRSCPQTTCSVVGTLTGGDILSVIDTVTGDAFSGSTNWYRLDYENGMDAFIHEALVDVDEPAEGIFDERISPLRISDMLVTAEGDLYAYDMTSRQVIAWLPVFEDLDDDEQTHPILTSYNQQVLTQLETFEGDVLLAQAPSGALVAGLPTGAIVRLDDDRILLEFDDPVQDMTFGEDGNLYLVTGVDDNQSILQYNTALNQQALIYDIPFEDDIHLFRASELSLWVVYTSARMAERIDFEGSVLETVRIPDNQMTPMATYGDTLGHLYFSAYGTGSLWRYTSLGWQEIGQGFGDVRVIVSSPDGQRLYIVEAGSIGYLDLPR